MKLCFVPTYACYPILQKIFREAYLSIYLSIHHIFFLLVSHENLPSTITNPQVSFVRVISTVVCDWVNWLLLGYNLVICICQSWMSWKIIPFQVFTIILCMWWDHEILSVWSWDYWSTSLDHIFQKQRGCINIQTEYIYSLWSVQDNKNLISYKLRTMVLLLCWSRSRRRRIHRCSTLSTPTSIINNQNKLIN